MDIRTVHCLVDTAKCCASIVLNLGLLNLILRHSTERLQVYQGILLMTCAADIMLSSVVLFTQPVGCGKIEVVKLDFALGDLLYRRRKNGSDCKWRIFGFER